MPTIFSKERLPHPLTGVPVREIPLFDDKKLKDRPPILTSNIGVLGAYNQVEAFRERVDNLVQAFVNEHEFALRGLLKGASLVFRHDLIVEPEERLHDDGNFYLLKFVSSAVLNGSGSKSIDLTAFNKKLRGVHAELDEKIKSEVVVYHAPFKRK